MSGFLSLPTFTAKQVFKDLSPSLRQEQVNTYGALFQRLSLVTSYENCVKALQIQLDKDSHKLTVEDGENLLFVYKLTKHEVLGLAVETLSDVTKSSMTAQKDKVTAATVINELYGEKELIKDSVLTDKVVLNLVRNGS